MQGIQEVLTKRCLSSVRNAVLSAFWCGETLFREQACSKALFLSLFLIVKYCEV